MVDKFALYCIPARLIGSILLLLLPVQVAIVICGTLILSLIYKYVQYEPGQKATFDRSLVVTWNKQRLFHIMILLLFIVFISYNRPIAAASVLFIDTLASLSCKYFSCIY